MTESTILANGTHLTVRQNGCSPDVFVIQYELDNIQDEVSLTDREHFFGILSRVLKRELGPQGSLLDAKFSQALDDAIAWKNAKVNPDEGDHLIIDGACSDKLCTSEFVVQGATCKIKVARLKIGVISITAKISFEP